jgi:hypothetical protein
MPQTGSSKNMYGSSVIESTAAYQSNEVTRWRMNKP